MGWRLYQGGASRLFAVKSKVSLEQWKVYGVQSEYEPAGSSLSSLTLQPANALLSPFRSHLGDGGVDCVHD